MLIKLHKSADNSVSKKSSAHLQSKNDDANSEIEVTEKRCISPEER